MKPLKEQDGIKEDVTLEVIDLDEDMQESVPRKREPDVEEKPVRRQRQKDEEEELPKKGFEPLFLISLVILAAIIIAAFIWATKLAGMGTAVVVLLFLAEIVMAVFLSRAPFVISVVIAVLQIVCGYFFNQQILLVCGCFVFIVVALSVKLRRMN